MQLHVQRLHVLSVCICKYTLTFGGKVFADAPIKQSRAIPNHCAKNRNRDQYLSGKRGNGANTDIQTQNSGIAYKIIFRNCALLQLSGLRGNAKGGSYKCACNSGRRRGKVCHAVDSRTADSAGRRSLRGIQTDIFPVFCRKFRQLFAVLELSADSKDEPCTAFDRGRNTSRMCAFCQCWLGLLIGSIAPLLMDFSDVRFFFFCRLVDPTQLCVRISYDGRLHPFFKRRAHFFFQLPNRLDCPVFRPVELG